MSQKLDSVQGSPEQLRIAQPTVSTLLSQEAPGQGSLQPL